MYKCKVGCKNRGLLKISYLPDELLHHDPLKRKFLLAPAVTSSMIHCALALKKVGHPDWLKWYFQMTDFLCYVIVRSLGWTKTNLDFSFFTFPNRGTSKGIFSVKTRSVKSQCFLLVAKSQRASPPLCETSCAKSVAVSPSHYEQLTALELKWRRNWFIVEFTRRRDKQESWWSTRSEG